MDRDTILEVILGAMRSSNLSRQEKQRIDVSSTAPLFGPPSPLDSLGLVALLIDVEEALAEQGHAVVLTDERALSQRHSPFRDVPSLVKYIEHLLNERVA